MAPKGENKSPDSTTLPRFSAGILGPVEKRQHVRGVDASIKEDASIPFGVVVDLVVELKTFRYPV